MRAVILFAASLLAAQAVHASSAFNGRWVDDLDTQRGQAGSDRFLVVHGLYNCFSCKPPRSYPADGRMRPVPGDVSILSESVTITGPRSIVTRIVEPQMTRETTMRVAPDGKTATYVSLDTWPGYRKTLRTTYLARRMAPAAVGTHAVSGAWVGVRYREVPEEYRSVDLQEMGDQFTRSNFRHGHYTAKIGGPAAPVLGDGKNIYTARVRAPDDRTRVELIFLNDTAVAERTYRLSVDGKSMVTTVRDPQTGSVFTTVSHRK